MNHACPLCNADLSRKKLKKVPLEGEFSWMAFRWYLKCPSCYGALQENPHPFEKAVFPVLMLIVSLLNFGAFLFGYKASLLTLVMCIALFFIGPIVGRAIAVPGDWNRHAPYSPPRL